MSRHGTLFHHHGYHSLTLIHESDSGKFDTKMKPLGWAVGYSAVFSQGDFLGPRFCLRMASYNYFLNSGFGIK